MLAIKNLFNLILYSILLCFVCAQSSCKGQVAKQKASVYKVESDQPIGRVIRKVFEDSKGNIWLAGEGNILYFDGHKINTLNGIQNQEGRGVTIKDIAEGKDGKIWFGHTGGLSSFDYNSVKNYYESDGLPSNDIWDIFIDSKNRVWIGSIEGVCFFNGKTFTPFTLPKGQIDSTRGISTAEMVHYILEDSQHNIWFATNGGAYYYNGSDLKHLSTRNGLSGNFVSCIAEDQFGNIWIGTTHNGLNCFNGKQFVNFSGKSTLENSSIWALYHDQSNAIWISAKHKGVYKYNGHSLIHYATEKGFTTPGFLSIMQDRKKRMWFGGVNYVYTFDGNAFRNVNEECVW